MNPTDWHQLALIDLRDTDLSYVEIGRKYGRGRDTIIKLRVRHNVIRKFPPANGPRKAATADAISPLHRSLGIRVTLFRGGRTISEMSKLCNLSRIVLHQIEIGTADLSLSRLQALANVMNTPIPVLLSPFKPLGGSGHSNH